MKKINNPLFLILVAMSISIHTHASVVPAVLDQKNKEIVRLSISEIKTFQKSQQENCADPEADGSLAERQAQEMENQKKLATKPIDLGKIYNIGNKNGCFASLSNFPDLSVSIPSLTGILDSLKSTLIKYAVRKTCAVVDEAFSEMLKPLEEAVNKVSNRGQLDLTGTVNKEVAKKLYEIDPELGRVSKPAKDDAEYSFEW